ncbi:hypothetical protein QTN47_10850 [Danxiaibacter flavus]|uniref:Lipoprotein n=1 Tax=Danxiaibacter flavus TaxID=3049108 RepID=A0ABV3ZDQ4_9BACT|nr:hypothetical protein QNM32_10855 [Chitinophagaceae bacterium DXS]
MKKRYSCLPLIFLFVFSNIFCNKNEYSKECGATKSTGTSINYGCFIPSQITETNCHIDVGLGLSQMVFTLDMRMRDSKLYLERLKAAKRNCEPVCISLFKNTCYISEISPASPEIIDRYKGSYPCNGESF